MDTDYLASLSPEELESKKIEARKAMALEDHKEAPLKQTVPTAQTKKTEVSPQKNAPLFEDLAKKALTRSHAGIANVFSQEQVLRDKTKTPSFNEVLEEQARESSNLEKTSTIIPPMAEINSPRAEQEEEKKPVNIANNTQGSRNAVFNWEGEENKRLNSSRERRLFVLLGAIVLTLSGIAVIIFALLRTKNNTVLTIPIVRLTEILTPDSEVTVLLEDKTKSHSLMVETLKAGEIKKGGIRRIVPLLVGWQNKTEMKTAQFFEYMDIALPENIARSAAEQFAYGQYQDENRVAFIAIKIEKGEVSYQNTFIGMGSWEKNMPNDLRDMLDIKTAERPVWQDSLIQNIPVRIFGEISAPSLIWGFIDKETVLITTNTTTFGVVVERLSKGPLTP